MADDLPYRAEYSKSSRASCKTCKEKIAKDVLRLAAMVQSPVFDGKVPNWYHFSCFFLKQRPRTVADIGHFDSLRWEDQEKIKEKIGSGAAGPSVSSKNKKGGKSILVGDFTTEYAKSGKSMCHGCEKKIDKDLVRIGKKEYESERAMKYGPVDQWHHVDCFLRKREELEFFDSGDILPGFNTLSADDKKMLRAKFPKIAVKRKAKEETDTDVPIKKSKTDDDENALKQQNETMFKYRDRLSRHLNKKELAALLEYNKQEVPTGESLILDRLSDQMAFGALENCDVCKNGCFVFCSGKGYVCCGNLTEWTKCANILLDPKRSPFKIPTELKEEISFLKKYKGHVSKRIIPNRGPTSAAVKAEKVRTSNKPLEGMSFVLVGDHFKSEKKYDLTKQIKSMGGKVTTTVTKNTAAIITTADTLCRKNKKIDAAKENNIRCVTEDFLQEVEAEGATRLIEKKNIAPWDCEVSESSIKAHGSLLFTKSMPSKQKLKLKGGAAVDPDSGLENCAHVYQRGSKLCTAVLGMVNIARGSNSYYKLQLLESDNKREWWVFRSWGRIGTTIGNDKLEDMEDLNDALRHFEAIYEEKTGNRFSAEYRKVPGKWYPLDIDYRQDETDGKMQPLAAGSKSKLPKPVQELVQLLFDVESMKSALVEFEIDLKKMPLGKLSKRQIAQAYTVLSEASQHLKTAEQAKQESPEEGDMPNLSAIKGHLLDCSNRFYTLIPHDFGMKTPPLLDNNELIKTKVEMLDNLSEIEIAYSLLKSENDSQDEDADPIDKHYQKLNTSIEVLEKSTEEFLLIQEYLKNTHAATHTQYSLTVEEVFKIERTGEKKRFKQFKKLPNRHLLWHGSRLTNYAGILSKGLRIAPPEAPSTGYMFGKGIYFADMVSKSANYCCTSKSNPTGLMLLSEVALGNMYERLTADYIEKLPSGKHSVKGVGQTCPDPTQNRQMEDGVILPLGKAITAEATSATRSSLLYNEYIVYDVAQVNIKYLLNLKFNYKY